MQGAGFERIVPRYRDRMHREARMPQYDVAAFLSDHNVTKPFQSANDAIRGYAPRQPHAASTGISSSFT